MEEDPILLSSINSGAFGENKLRRSLPTLYGDFVKGKNQPSVKVFRLVISEIRKLAHLVSLLEKICNKMSSLADNLPYFSRRVGPLCCSRREHEMLFSWYGERRSCL